MNEVTFRFGEATKSDKAIVGSDLNNPNTPPGKAFAHCAETLIKLGWPVEELAYDIGGRNGTVPIKTLVPA